MNPKHKKHTENCDTAHHSHISEEEKVSDLLGMSLQRNKKIFHL